MKNLISFIVNCAKAFDICSPVVSCRNETSSFSSAVEVIDLCASDSDCDEVEYPAAAIFPSNEDLDLFQPSIVAEYLLESFVLCRYSLHIRTAVALIASVCLMKYQRWRVRRSHPKRPLYLHHLSAGTVLAAILHTEAFAVVSSPMNAGDAIVPEKDYALSTEFLRYLLGSEYTPHRRGRWYDRLCINLDRFALAHEQLAGDIQAPLFASAVRAVTKHYLQEALYKDSAVKVQYLPKFVE